MDPFSRVDPDPRNFLPDPEKSFRVRIRAVRIRNEFEKSLFWVGDTGSEIRF
jgi:hypothetical protein